MSSPTSDELHRSLKVALAILHADPRRGGAERYTADLAAALRSRGHHIAIVSSTGAPESHAHDVVLDPRLLTRTGRYRGFLRMLDAHGAEARYDIVHAMLPVNRCDVYHPHAGLAAVADAEGHLKYDGALLQFTSKIGNRLNARRRWFARTERDLLTGASPPIVICLSNYVRQTVSAHYALDPSLLATLFNAVDLTRFDPALRPDAGGAIRRQFRIDSGRVVALMIAQDFRRKGLREAIVAMARIPHLPLTLLVAGKDDPRPFAELAKREGVADRVIFAGSTSDPYAFYQAADFFVLPTRHDPCSLVVLESLAMGVPVISTRFNGACEIMTDGHHGFVLNDPSDIGGLSVALEQVSDAGRRQAMAAACMALRPRLEYSHHVDQLMKIYADATRTRA